MANIDYAGLLTGISGQNQQIDPFSLPTAAQQRMAFGAQQAQGMQRAGEGLFGMPSQQNPVDMAKTELIKLDKNDPEYQQKFIKLLGIADPAKAAELRQELIKKDETTAQTTAKTAQAEAVAQGLETTYPQLAASIRLGNPDALKKGVDILGSTNTADRYKVVGNNVFDVVNEKFVKSPDNNKEYDIKETWSEEKQANVIQWTEKGNPNIVVKELLAAKDIATQSVFIGKQIKETTEAARAAAIKAASADSIAKRFEETNPVGGIFSTAEEATKAFLGLQDETSSLKIEANRLITGNAVQNLPRGPASDKDIALVLAG